jgi:hypothetical protein
MSQSTLIVKANDDHTLHSDSGTTFWDVNSSFPAKLIAHAMTRTPLRTLALVALLSAFGALSAHAQFERNWEFSAAQGNKPAYVESNNDARSLAYGVVDDGNGNMVERVFVVDGGNDPYSIHILDANDGSDTGNDLPGVEDLTTPEDGRKVTDVSVTDDGVIIACNEVNSTFGDNEATENFRCYRWNSLTDSPTMIIDFTPPDNSDNDSSEGDWLGRQFTVTGEASDNSLTLLVAATKESPYVYRFTTTDNGQSFSAEAIERGDRPPSGNINAVAPKGPGSSPFLFNELTTQPLSYSASGSEQAQDPGFFSNFTHSLKYFEANSREWMVTFNWETGDQGHFAELADITDGLDSPQFYGTTPNLGTELNTNGTGDVDVRVNDDGTATIFVIVTNNGIGSYTTTDTPLPVELASFEAARNGNVVELRWQTASETNNAGFRVQHETRNDGWTKLGFVESKAAGGTTTETQRYRFSVGDDLSPGPHHFRLQQVDLDGSTHLSDAVTVEVPMQEALRLGAPSPNPVLGAATLSFAVKQETEATIAVYNTLGQKVATPYRGTPPAGRTMDVTVRTESLPSGQYFVRLRAGDQTRTRRLTVLR